MLVNQKYLWVWWLCDTRSKDDDHLVVVDSNAGDGDCDDHRGGSTPRGCEELEVPEEDQVFQIYI